MTRREFITLLGGAPVASSLATHAQDSPTATVPQIALLRCVSRSASKFRTSCCAPTR